MTTLRRSTQQISLPLTYGARGGPAKTSATDSQIEKDSAGPEADSSIHLWSSLNKLSQPGWSWKMCRASYRQSKEPLLRSLPTRWKRSGIWGDGYRVTLAMRACPKTEIEYSLSQVLEQTVPIKSLLTAANCLGILRREYRNGRIRKLDRKFRLALSQTLRLWFSPTIRAQTGRHQGGHSDRPILCGQKFDLERMRETDGGPPRLDGRRGRLIGNAVSPKIAEWIGRIISKQADATIEEVA